MKEKPQGKSPGANGGSVQRSVSTKTIEPVYRSLGAKIEQLRTTLGWTQDELAKKVGLARGSVANIEAGRQRILLHDVERFSAAFGVSPKLLLRGIWC